MLGKRRRREAGDNGEGNNNGDDDDDSEGDNYSKGDNNGKGSDNGESDGGSAPKAGSNLQALTARGGSLELSGQRIINRSRGRKRKATLATTGEAAIMNIKMATSTTNDVGGEACLYSAMAQRCVERLCQEGVGESLFAPWLQLILGQVFGPAGAHALADIITPITAEGREYAATNNAALKADELTKDGFAAEANFLRYWAVASAPLTVRTGRSRLHLAIAQVRVVEQWDAWGRMCDSVEGKGRVVEFLDKVRAPEKSDARLKSRLAGWYAATLGLKSNVAFTSRIYLWRVLEIFTRSFGMGVLPLMIGAVGQQIGRAHV